jgi:hypothetical protein
MNPNRKVLITVLSFVLAMVVIACSCSSLIPTPTAVPLPPTITSLPPNPMPGLAGTWHDPDTNDVFQVAWQGGQYVVTSVTWQGTSYSITSQSWDGSNLSWSYFDSTLNLTVTHTTTSLSGDSLYANWSYSDGSSGTETLARGEPPAATPTIQPPVNQEAMPGLAGKWQDPETTDTATVVWQNNTYVVTSVIWQTHSYTITSQSWDGSKLTWSYYDTDLSLTTTYSTTGLSGDYLYVDWYYSDGSGSGTETLSRVP